MKHSFLIMLATASITSIVATNGWSFPADDRLLTDESSYVARNSAATTTGEAEDQEGKKKKKKKRRGKLSAEDSVVFCDCMEDAYFIEHFKIRCARWIDRKNVRYNVLLNKGQTKCPNFIRYGDGHRDFCTCMFSAELHPSRQTDCKNNFYRDLGRTTSKSPREIIDYVDAMVCPTRADMYKMPGDD